MGANDTSAPARFDAGALKALVRDAAAAAGVGADDAPLLADALVEADIAGVATHGVSRLAIYLRRIRQGLIDPRAQLRIDRERAATLALDAGNGLGQVQALKALALLAPRARAGGIAAATLRRSQHFGALGYYANWAAARGMILLVMSNGEPAMSPEGSSEAFFGTNPIAASFPSGKGFAVKIDLATSIVARGNIIAAQKQGRPIPAGWALDAKGEPTTDAAAALAGTVLTMAGPKGYALALMVEMFSGVLSGAGVGRQVGSMYKHLDRPQNVGHWLMLVDIAAFVEVEEFVRRVDATIDAIKASRLRPGAKEILIPGERAQRVAERNRRDGVPLDAATLTELEAVCREAGVPFALGRKPAEASS